MDEPVKNYAILSASLLLTSLYSGQLSADERLDSQKAALELIQKFANDICNKVVLDGGYQKIEADGSLNAGLAGVIKKITDLGFSGAARISIEQYSGLLRQDLPTAIKDNASCKE